MSGSIEEVPLPDLLQLFGTSKKSGVLVIRTESDDTGKIFMRKGVIYYASINDLEDVQVNFDGITYAKGGSVLKQLVAWVGIDAFFAGVAAYFK